MVAFPNETQQYAARVSGYDEAITGRGELLPAWRNFLPRVQRADEETRRAWSASIRRDLRDDGLTFTMASEANGSQGRGQKGREDLDALPWVFSSDEWAQIEAGVSQRMRLLEAVAHDLLGPRKLVRDGMVPADLIFAHAGYLRACVNLPANLGAHLFFYAADLARGPDGRMWVLDDKTQAPSGAGYALENRTILGRVFPDMLGGLHVRRLAPYFRTFRDSMMQMYEGRRLEPRIVVLTPGPYSATYFEHAYLATYLGYTLVQGDDLVMRDGALWLKTLEGLQPVDILIRRLDAEFCDPLELRRDSYLGVPGLLGAMRNGRVACVNHPGSGVLENRGLMPFLPGLCRHLLGESPLLPSAATWWCGQPRECSHVLAHLRELVIKPIHRNSGEETIYGWTCSEKELQALKTRIQSRPMQYIGQEHIGFSTVPLLLDGRLEPRRSVLRTFACATPNGPAVMPGGLARSAAEPDSLRVSVGEGGILKDVWVLGKKAETHRSLWHETDTPKDQAWFGGVFTSRSADHLFWVGRYAERIGRQSRLARGILQTRSALTDDDDTTEVCLDHMADLMDVYCGREPEEEVQPLSARLKRAMKGKKDEPGCVLSNLRALLYAAYNVRDIWSQDTWRALTAIENTGERCCRELDSPFVLGEDLDEMVEKLYAFYGLNAGGMTRESGWHMLMLGRTLEAGLGLCDLTHHLLLCDNPPEQMQALMEVALSQNENLITYRRHYRTTPRLHSVLDLMLSMEANPRSLVFLLSQAAEYLHQLPPPVHPEVFDEILLNLKQLRNQTLQRAWHDREARRQLPELLFEARSVMQQCAMVITSAYFTHTSTHALEAY
ncbi:MAG: circularly permuted type 2 ATP-grasp protein [Verrucomicrobia bacterium]|nr:circularly permuted type 2 ATP-grasp protein [Verrucomicrobiota bacterium]MCH8512655.1 circularly permuted type 2 ATP-grasp protein [Kiritimatiellia bacterium]